MQDRSLGGSNRRDVRPSLPPDAEAVRPEHVRRRVRVQRVGRAYSYDVGQAGDLSPVRRSQIVGRVLVSPYTDFGEPGA